MSLKTLYLLLAISLATAEYPYTSWRVGNPDIYTNSKAGSLLISNGKDGMGSDIGEKAFKWMIE